MYYPTLKEVKHLQEAEARGDEQPQGRPLLPLYCDILADMETPVSAYCKTAQRPYSFLLESVSGGEQVARYSFIGIDPYMVMTHKGDTAIVRRMDSGHANIEEIPCYDPLAFIEAELGQYRLVVPQGKTQDEF